MTTIAKNGNEILLEENALSELLVNLNGLLADYHIYYQNLRGLHWNIKGKFFFGLHERFEELYTEAAGAIDELAERILTLGGQPLHTLKDYVQHAKLPVAKNVEDAETSIHVVLDNSRYLLTRFREILQLAQDNQDEGTVAMMGEYIAGTEKRIWMFSSVLK
ncbi:MAG: DNA starvation/stationary phase protection protein [Cyclobacteriaceae bacterium]|nr:DNA starvation/stationary phase protection protein [Cyclobacteriaceae bacterium]